MENYEDLFRLEKKVAVVTGALGQLGTELTKTLGTFGADIVITDLDEKLCKSRAEQLEEEGYGHFYGQECDVTNPKTIESLRDFLQNNLTGLDILVNCAGIGVYTPFEERTQEELDGVIDVNLKGTINCSRILGELMKTKGGSIINIGSIYGQVSSDRRIYGDSKRNNSEIYSATKAGVIHFTKYLATYWAEYNIRVNCISPGGIINVKKVTKEEYMEFVNKYSNKVPMARMANVDDIVGPIVFLASDSSKYITGQNLTIDGGFTAW